MLINLHYLCFHFFSILITINLLWRIFMKIKQTILLVHWRSRCKLIFVIFNNNHFFFRITFLSNSSSVKSIGSIYFIYSLNYFKLIFPNFNFLTKFNSLKKLSKNIYYKFISSKSLKSFACLIFFRNDLLFLILFSYWVKFNF